MVSMPGRCHILLGGALVAFALGVAACGPSATAGPDAYPVPRATVTGRVWVPGQGPGQVPDGQEIPVFGAEVYLSVDRPEPIPDHVYCQRCADAPPQAIYSDHDGSFELGPYPAGTYWLVIQKGQFRLEQQVTLDLGELRLDAAATTLPSVHDPDHGAYVPRMAIALGTNDNIEDVLGKLGLGAYDPTTFTFAGPGGEVDVYDNGYALPGSMGTVTDLFTDLDQMRRYHLILLPCSTQTTAVSVLTDQAVLANIRRYVAEGGRLYVTDWSGEAIDRPFPPQLELGDVGADSVGTYDPATFTGTLTEVGTADGERYDAADAEVVDDDLAAWLGLQLGPTPDSPTPQVYDPASFLASDNWNWIRGLGTVETGVDEQGAPVEDVPKPWVVGSGPATGGVKQPLTVTFEPAGCGRVMYSTYQTANGHHPGLYPQERVLLFLIMEIGVCSNPPVVN